LSGCLEKKALELSLHSLFVTDPQAVHFPDLFSD